MVDDFVNPNHDPTDLVEEPETDTKDFTEDEREAYYIVKAIASSVINPSRVTYKDTKCCCNILLDNNSWTKIARLYFNKPKKKAIVIYSIDAEGKESSETFPIGDLNEIYQYSDMLKAIVISQDRSRSVKS